MSMLEVVQGSTLTNELMKLLDPRSRWSWCAAIMVPIG
jgi:hypothetical protein